MVTQSQEEAVYRLAPLGWSVADPNPYAQEDAPPGGWTHAEIEDKRRGWSFTGPTPRRMFSVRWDRDVPNLMSRLADLLRYESRHGRAVLLCVPPDIDGDTFVKDALAQTPPPHVVRDSDPKWVTHSTDLDAWTRIRADGALKSSATLLAEGAKPDDLGFRVLGEPAEYADYVMLGSMERVGGEHVVASRQAGRIVTDEDRPYEPGVRLYFDNHALIRAGLGERDGAHLIKAAGRLPLEPYLVEAVSARDVEVEASVAWTPATFHAAANASFLGRPLGPR
jgi:hypothetical protein